MAELAFLSLCHQALNPPFSDGQIIEFGKFCFDKDFDKTKSEPKLPYFSKYVIVKLYRQSETYD